MSLYETLTVVQMIAMALVAAAVATLRWGAHGGSIVKRIETLESWKQHVGQKWSDLSDEVQRLPHVLSAGDDGFISRREAMLLVEESRRDRAQLWLRLDAMLKNGPRADRQRTRGDER